MELDVQQTQWDASIIIDILFRQNLRILQNLFKIDIIL